MEMAENDTSKTCKALLLLSKQYHLISKLNFCLVCNAFFSEIKNFFWCSQEVKILEDHILRA